MPAKSRQITVYLTAAERSEFESYARHFMLDAAGLLVLLFARELRVGRLRALIERDETPDGSRKPKVTARVRAADHVSLIEMATRYDNKLSFLGAVLIRDELMQRWLERATTTLFESRGG